MYFVKVCNVPHAKTGLVDQGCHVSLQMKTQRLYIVGISRVNPRNTYM